jgi:hypothetical protein
MTKVKRKSAKSKHKQKLLKDYTENWRLSKQHETDTRDSCALTENMFFS